MGFFIAILVIYCVYQLNRGGNNGMFTKLKAVWFEAQHGEGSVVKATLDCIHPHSGILLRVKFSARFLRRNRIDTVLIRVPRAFAAESETVQDAVLAEILGRSGFSVGSIDRIEEVEEPLPIAQNIAELTD